MLVVLPVIGELEADDLSDDQSVLQSQAMVCLVDGALEQADTNGVLILLANGTACC